jgi:hypothetical protein
MGTSPVRFDGQDLYQPGAYSKRDISAANKGAASGSNLLILAETSKGIPFNATADYSDPNDRVNYVNGTTQMKEKIGTGNNGYDAARFALSPTNQPGVNGAPRAGMIRVNKATKGALTILDVDSDNVLDIKSVDYGLYVNQIQVKIDAGTNVGKRLSVKFEGETKASDDLDNQLIEISYSGAGTAAVLQIDPVGSLVIEPTGAASDNISLAMATYTTVQALADAINAFSPAVYTAVVIGDGAFQTKYLDKVIAGDAVDLVAGDEIIHATLKAVEDAIFNNERIESTLSAAYERRLPANMGAFSSLVGGTNGAAVVLQDWVDALAMAEKIDASFVCVATGDAAVHAALAAHVKRMSSVLGKNERQGGCGAALNLTDSAIRQEAQALNANLTDYFGSQGTQFDEFGNVKTYPGFIWSCAVKGMQAGNAITFAPTAKSLVMLSVKEVDDADAMIKAGVQIAQPDEELGGIRVTRSVTTYQGSNLIANESSMMRTSLFVAKDHRAAIKGFIGEAGDTPNLNAVAARAENKLDDYVDAKYFVFDPAKGNAYRNFTFKVVGDTIEPDYEATLVSPINFILTTHHFTTIGADE